MYGSNDFDAVLLAGGESSRMGLDKSQLILHGKPLIRILTGCLRQVAGRVWISSARTDLAEEEVEVVPDLFPGRGPLAGIHAAFHASRRPWLLVLACDLPGITVEFLEHLIEATSGFDGVLPVTSDGRMHPTCAAYHRKCLPFIDRYMTEERYRLLQLLDEPDLRIHRWTAAEGQFPDTALWNANTPDEYHQFQYLPKP
jgi:molybdopterin-guanine dinucleotide biosynthesis protein A